MLPINKKDVGIYQGQVLTTDSYAVLFECEDLSGLDPCVVGCQDLTPLFFTVGLKFHKFDPLSPHICEVRQQTN